MLSLYLQAELMNIQGLKPLDTEESNHHYTFKVSCTACREIHPNPVSINRHEEHEIPGSRGTANLVIKCKFCQKTNTAQITDGPHTYVASSEAPSKQKILDLDCRGLDLVEFIPDGTWQATGESGKSTFTEITFEEGDWYDYDENAGNEVSITDLNWTISQ